MNAVSSVLGRASFKKMADELLIELSDEANWDW